MTALEETRAIAQLAGTKERLLLSQVSWPAYQALLKEWGPRTPRHTYDRGRLEITTRPSEHEIYKSLLGTLFAVLAEEHELPYVAGGELTLKRADVDRGIEPDCCYWTTNEAQVRGKLHIDLERDPPPDLFLEIEISRTVLNRVRVLAKLGVGKCGVTAARGFTSACCRRRDATLGAEAARCFRRWNWLSSNRTWRLPRVWTI
jgi:Uma2 family endonuclease